MPGSASVCLPPCPPSLLTGTFRAAGCVPFRAGAFDAVGDGMPVPERAMCPRPQKNVPVRADTSPAVTSGRAETPANTRRLATDW